jgi:hypothetical protein
MDESLDAKGRCATSRFATGLARKAAKTRKVYRRKEYLAQACCSQFLRLCAFACKKTSRQGFMGQNRKDTQSASFLIYADPAKLRRLACPYLPAGKGAKHRHRATFW